MNTSIKKLLAGAAIVSSAASVAYFGFVSAQNAGQGFEGAEVNNVTNTGFTVTGAQLSGADYDFSNSGLSYVRVYSGDNEEFNYPTSGSIVNSGNNTFTLSGDFSFLGTGNYRVSFGSEHGDGAAVLSINNANEVTVSARVEPILRMALSESALDFGTLTQNYTGVTMSGEVGTNAVDGLTVTVNSKNGGLFSQSSDHTISTGNSDYSNESYTFQSSVNTGDIVTTSTATGLNEIEITDSSDYTIYDTDGPEIFKNTDDFQFDIKSRISETTPAASDYTDTVTYTVTANF